MNTQEPRPLGPETDNLAPEETLDSNPQQSGQLKREQSQEIIACRQESSEEAIPAHQKKEEGEIQEGQSSNVDELTEELVLKQIKSTEELKCDFKQNAKILTSLTSNIDSLFKKISQLNEEITEEVPDSPKIQLKSPQRKTKSQRSDKHSGENSEKHSQKSKEDTQNDTQHDQHSSKCDSETVPSQHTIEYPQLFTHLPLSNHGLNMKMFQLGKSVGYGKFGEVLQCRHIETGHLYALKKIFKSTVSEYKMGEQLLTELAALKKMEHPNVVRTYTAFTDEFHIFIVMEYAQGQQLIKKFKSSEHEVSQLIRQVLLALQYIHAQGVIHRDLKPQNIIYTNSGVIKICDFGWAALDNSSMDIMCGTLDYVTPEMVNKETYTNSVDLWGLGVLTYELLFGVAPFKEKDKSATFEKVKNIDLKFPEEISEQCQDFFEGYLTAEKNRKDVDWGLSHPFITKNMAAKEGEIDEELGAKMGQLFDC